MEDMHGRRVEDDATLAERIVRGAIRAYRLHPFHDVDAATIAETCGVDHAVVDRLFPTWDGLLLVVYDRWLQLRGSRRSTAPRCPIDHVRTTMADDVADPGLVRLLAGVVTLAASECDFAGFFRGRFEEYVEELTVGLERDVDAGVDHRHPGAPGGHTAARGVRGAATADARPAVPRRAGGVRPCRAHAPARVA